MIGFQGTEGGISPGAGGGTGGYLPPGLTIPKESIKTTITETSVTIEWTTSYPATSQVIYAKEGESRTLCLTQTEGCAIGTPPKYGYAHTTPEYNTSPKVTPHSVTITGLTTGTKYYYRVVSHASLAISQEFSFNTLGLKEETSEKTKEEKIAFSQPKEGPVGGEEVGSEEKELAGEKGIEKPTIEKPITEGKRSRQEVFGEKGLLAAIGAAIGTMPLHSKLILLLILTVFAVLIVLNVIIKRKRGEKKKI